MSLGSKLAPSWGVASWNIRPRKTNFKVSLWTFIKFVHIMSWGRNWPHPSGHKLEHKNKEDQLKNSSLKLESLELWYLVCSISLWTFINCIHMIPLGSKPGDHKLEHRNKEDQLQNYSFLKLGGIELWFLAPLAIGQQAYVMVHCPWCVRPSVCAFNFFFKHILLWNYLSDFDEISQKCSHHGPLQNFLK